MLSADGSAFAFAFAALVVALAAFASAFGSDSLTAELVTNFPSLVGISRSSSSAAPPTPLRHRPVHSASSVLSLESPPSHPFTSSTPTPNPIIPLSSPCCSSAAVNSASAKNDGSTGSDISPCQDPAANPPLFTTSPSGASSPSPSPSIWLSCCSPVCAICCAIAYIACALARSLPSAARKGGEREAVRTKLRMCAGSAAQYAPSGLSPPPPA